jgi:hypothetical protein
MAMSSFGLIPISMKEAEAKTSSPVKMQNAMPLSEDDLSLNIPAKATTFRARYRTEAEVKSSTFSMALTPYNQTISLGL